jgi:histidine ammonia-lyase
MEGGAATEVARPVPRAESPFVRFGGAPIRLEDVLAIARGEARAALDADPAVRRRIRASVETLRRHLGEGRPVYGVSTGVGEACLNSIPEEAVSSLPLNLVRLHGCGTGRALDEVEAAAVLTARLASLARGQSAVREELLELLCDSLNAGVLPRIPAEGSVGASGDLTPLSYVAAALIGEREVSYRGRVMPAAAALLEAGLTAITLAPKEALALMNGTSVMTGLASLAYDRCARLARLSASLTAVASDVLRGNRMHFHQRIFALKPHPGQALVARWIRDDIDLVDDEAVHAGRIQDRYSIRCAPHVVGVLVDALRFARDVLEVELNGVNDNPIVDGEAGLILNGGNFYGGHVCFVMDGLKAAVASVADLMDRQMVLLCAPSADSGLPPDLVGRSGGDRVLHHGFKAMQITTSALAAEAQKLTMPASAFSRSTESHNQDKVSMGTIAARDCLRVLELAEQVAIIVLLAACQAVDLRKGEGCHTRAKALHAAVRQHVPFTDADRRHDLDIHALLVLYRGRALPLGDFDEIVGARQTGGSLDSE